MFEVGDTFHFLQYPTREYKAHVVGIVDDDYVVYKWYGKYKQWWHYDVKHIEDILIMINRVRLERENNASKEI